MNNHELGAYRDRKVLSMVQGCGALDAEQVRVLMFPRDTYGRRKAQKCLTRLYRRRKLKREIEPLQPYRYYIDFKQIDHRVGINWAYCWFRHQLKSWQTLEWEWEASFDHLRCDAFATITNKVGGAKHDYFIEFDNETGEFNAEKYDGLWWEQDYTVFVVCHTEKRAEKIRRPGFEVMTIPQIKEVLVGG